jgi:hypothetical protein
MTFNFLVLPQRDPPHEGTLFIVNEIDWIDTPTPTYEVNGGDHVTVRVIMDMSTGTFKWNKPVITWTCFELVNENYGDFNTGYYQYLVKALTLDHDCSQDVTLVHSDGSGNEDWIIINVKQGKCVDVSCPVGEIQNLALDNCFCEAITYEGVLVDTDA